MTRLRTLALVATAAACIWAPSLGQATDARDAKLPAALGDVKRIKSLYPELWRIEQARKDGISWSRLRRGARELWMRSHPCATATLSRRYQTGARSSWETMQATWRCDRVDPGHIRFMSCIPRYEGGYGAPDVRFGGRTGDPTGLGLGNVVLGHLQLRPGWYHGAMSGRPGTYGRDFWTPELYLYARHPVNQARATAPIGADQYATKEMCL